MDSNDSGVSKTRAKLERQELLDVESVVQVSFLYTEDPRLNELPGERLCLLK